MAFTFISSSASDQAFGGIASGIEGNRAGGSPEATNLAPVRRPHRGIQIKDDTYAILSVYRADGKAIPLTSSSAREKEIPEGSVGKVDQYADFILQSITDQRQEKQQVIETFGDSFIFFFGERPRTVTISGLLLNTEDFNWRSQFWSNYENHLRGTRLVQQNARCFLSYDSIVLEGYPIQAQASEASDNPYAVQFSMTLFLTNYQDFSNIGDVYLPDADQAKDFPGVDVLNKELRGEAPVRDGLKGEASFQGITAAAEVRLNNFISSAQAGKGFGGFIREATKTIRNNAITDALDFVRDGLSLTLTGRVISRPAGTAGFLAQVGSVGIAANSLPTSQGSGISGVEQFIDAQSGSIKLRVPAPTRFVEQPQLRVPLYQNWDEYPLTFGRTIQAPPEAAFRAGQRFLQRKRIREQQRAELVELELSIQKENEVLRTIADVVNYTRKGFALIANAKAFANDPGAVAADAFGLGDVAGNDVTFGIPGIT